MIDRTHQLPIRRQCQLLQLARSTAYYQPRPVSDTTLALMCRIDELPLQYPFAGARMLRDVLRREGYRVGRRQVATLTRRMGITAVYRTPRTSRRHLAHRIYPYLLRQLEITRPNHVWAADITYIPMKRGFLYLCAILEWASRRVLAWRLSNTLTTDFCLDAAREAITRYGQPEIFNTDQGCRFTRLEFTGLLQGHGIQIRTISKLFEEHRDTGKLHKTKEVSGVILPTNEQPPFPLEPGKNRSTSQRRSYRRKWRPSCVFSFRVERWGAIMLTPSCLRSLSRPLLSYARSPMRCSGFASSM